MSRAGVGDAAVGDAAGGDEDLRRSPILGSLESSSLSTALRPSKLKWGLTQKMRSDVGTGWRAWRGAQACEGGFYSQRVGRGKVGTGKKGEGMGTFGWCNRQISCRV